MSVGEAGITRMVARIRLDLTDRKAWPVGGKEEGG